MNVNFYLHNKNAKKPTAIQMYVSYNGLRSKYETGLKVLPKYFKNQRFNYGPGKDKDNQLLEKLAYDLKELFRKLRNDTGRIPSHAELKNSFLGTTPTDFLGFATAYVEATTKRINPNTGKRLSKYVYYPYARCIKYLVEYAKIKRINLSFEAITLELHSGWTQWLTTTKNLAPSSVGKSISCLKAIMNAATEAGLNHNMAYKSTKFKKPTSESDTVYLTKSELKSLWELKLDPYNERIRDLFLVGCYTALRHANLSKIRPEDIKNGYLQIEAKKNERKVFLPLHPIVKSIFKKYDNKLPTYTNQPMNRALKVICQQVPELCLKVPHRKTKGGIRTDELIEKWKLIGTHTARRTFATNLLLDGFPLKGVMDLGGWSSRSSIAKYDRLPLEESAKRLESVWSREG